MRRAISAVVLSLATTFVSAAETRSINASPAILGIRVGTTMREAHEKLDPLCNPTDIPRAAGEPELERERAVWHFKETDFGWMMVWARDERIVAISVAFRPAKSKRFNKIDDVRRAASSSDSHVVWNFDDHVRLVANGANGRATSMYLLALDEKELD